MGEELWAWLRRLDQLVLGAFTAAGTPDEDEPVWSAVVAVLGGVLVPAGGLLATRHAGLQLGIVSAGLLLTVPHLQSRIDRVRATAED